MDIGKEFGVSAMDGAHEVPLVELTSTLAEKTAGYRYPGPVLSAAVEGGVTAALGPARVLRRRRWPSASPRTGASGRAGSARTALALALGTREGTSRRGGDLATLTAVDAPRASSTRPCWPPPPRRGSPWPRLPPPSTGGGTVDAAAVNELREHVEGILVDQASEVLARLGRVPGQRPAGRRLPRGAGHAGPARVRARAGHAGRPDVRPAPPRAARLRVHLGACRRGPPGAGARCAAESGQRGRRRRSTTLVDQVAAHRDADPRIRATLEYHRARLAGAGRPGTVALLDRALTAAPAGVPVPELEKLRDALSGGRRRARPGGGRGAGAGPGRLPRRGRAGDRRVAELDRVVVGGAPAARRCDRRAGHHHRHPGADRGLPRPRAAVRRPGRPAARRAGQPGLVRRHRRAASSGWSRRPSRTVGPITREVKPALWPTLVLPFAAAPAMGELPDTGRDSQLTLRLLLLGVQRLVGGLAERGQRGAQGPLQRDPADVAQPRHVRWRRRLRRRQGGPGDDGQQVELRGLPLGRPDADHLRGDRLGPRHRADGRQRPGRPVRRGRAGRGHLLRRADGRADRGPGHRAVPRARPTGRRCAWTCPAGSPAGPTWARPWPAPSPSSPRRPPPRARPEAEAGGTVAALPNLPALLAGARGPVEVPTGTSRATVRAEDMIVMVGIAEYGPWGSSATRWQAEVGRAGRGRRRRAGVALRAHRLGRLSRRLGRRRVGQPGGRGRHRRALPRAGARHAPACACSSTTTPWPPTAYWEFTEVFLDRALTKVLPAEAEARAMAANAPGALVTAGRGGLAADAAGRRLGADPAAPAPAACGGRAVPAGLRTRSATGWTPGSPARWTR